MKNKVELLGHYGSDQIIAQSAWTSTSRDLSEEKLARIPKLIEMLWTEGHETPFEKGNVHFLVTCDIASHIHLLKHRIASINAESARYKELKEDKYYLPKDWATIKSMDGVEILGGFKKGTELSWDTLLMYHSMQANQLYHKCLEELTPVLGRKRAKESARFFKTYNSQITADVQFNMRSFANFLKLRGSEHAQVEIRDIAWEMLLLVQGIEGNPFKHTLKMIKP
jgi:thymidylate synthase (FAD)